MFGCSMFTVFRRWGERPNERVITVGITSQMLLPTELLEPIGRGAVGKLYIATKPASSTCQ